MANWLDKMLSRVRDAKTEEDARAAVADYIDPSTGERKPQPGEDGDTHIHVHMPGAKGGEGGDMQGTDEDLPADPDEGGPPDMEELAARVAALEEQVRSLLENDEEDVELEGENEDGTKDARRFKLRRGSKLKIKDEDLPVPERNPDLMGETDLPGLEDLNKRMASGDKRGTRDRALTMDSADMEETWQDMVAAAEIIQPGIRTPTFDARLPMQRTAQRMCSHRRVVLDRAMKDESTRELITEVTGIKTGDEFRRLSCDSVKMAFNATADKIRATNNAGVVRHSVGDVGGKRVGDENRPKGPPTPAQMNKDAKAFWGGKTFH